MRRIITNKPGLTEILLLSALMLTGSILQSAPARVVADGPWLPPSPWENVQVAA
jgi:hypothetical protein